MDNFAIKIKNQLHWNKFLKPMLKTTGVYLPRWTRINFENTNYVGVMDDKFFLEDYTFVKKNKIPTIIYPTPKQPAFIPEQCQISTYPNLAEICNSTDEFLELMGYRSNQVSRLTNLPTIMSGCEKLLIKAKQIKKPIN